MTPSYHHARRRCYDSDQDCTRRRHGNQQQVPVVGRIGLFLCHRQSICNDCWLLSGHKNATAESWNSVFENAYLSLLFQISKNVPFYVFWNDVMPESRKKFRKSLVLNPSKWVHILAPSDHCNNVIQFPAPRVWSKQLAFETKKLAGLWR